MYQVLFFNNEEPPDSLQCASLDEARARVRAVLMDVVPTMNVDEIRRMETGLASLTEDGGEVLGSDAWKERAVITPLRPTRN